MKTEPDFNDAVTASLKRWPEQRRGQAVYITLHDMHPEIAERVHGTELDPFHHDERIPALLAFMGDWLRYDEALP